MKTLKQKIFGKNYNLLVAKTLKQKRNGMNIFRNCPPKTGMIFPYEKEESNRLFTLSKTPFSLLVIFLDKYNNVVYQEKAFKYQKKPVVCKKPSMTVIEIPLS